VLTLALAPALTLTWAWTQRPGIDIGVTEKYVQSEVESASNRHLQSNSALKLLYRKRIVVNILKRIEGMFLILVSLCFEANILKSIEANIFVF
jgi:hypothetical protein